MCESENRAIHMFTAATPKFTFNDFMFFIALNKNKNLN